MDDEDALLESIAEVDRYELEEEDEEVEEEVVRHVSPDDDEALDYSEDPEEGEEEVEEEGAGEIEEKVEEKKEKKEEEEKEEGELEDGELEDSDEDEKETVREPAGKRVPITAPPSSSSSGAELRRRPIEVGMNNSRITRPAARGFPRAQLFVPKQEESAASSWQETLMAAKKAMNKDKNPDDDDNSIGSFSPRGDEERRREIPSLMSVRTHKPKDLGPQVIYPSQRHAQPQQTHQQLRVKRDSGGAPSNHHNSVSASSVPRGRPPAGRALPLRRVSKSPPVRGISPERNVEEISSDSDEEAFRKRSPRHRRKSARSRSSRSSRSSSKSTIPGARPISDTSSDEERKRRGKRLRTYSTSSDKKEAKRRRHMKRTSGRDPSRSRSPPPYPPGHRKRKETQIVTGDIHNYRIPKRNSGATSRKNGSEKKAAPAEPAFLKDRNKIKRKRSETPPQKKRNEKGREGSKRRKDGRAQTISESDSDDSTSTFSSGDRKGRKRSKRRSPAKSASSSSSSSQSRSPSSSSGSSSDSSISKLPSAYRPRAPSEEKISSDEDEKSRTATATAPRSPSPTSALGSSHSSAPSSPRVPPPPPAEESEAPPPPEGPPPPPPTEAETRRQLKMRLKSINKILKVKPLDEGKSPAEA
ncbi:unnamed protein product [Caenorhabditis sp. 36 PRJEB53466]|nr:unnamed protein product [Caenorhabditis sp. 36 PRJEB53466]